MGVETKGMMVKVISDIDVRKREAIELFQDVGYVLRNRNLIDSSRIMEGTLQNDVHAYFRIKGTSKAIHLHAFTKLSNEMYPKSDRNIITSGRVVDYNKIKRQLKSSSISASTERIIYNQEKTGLDAQIIVDRLEANWPA